MKKYVKIILIIIGIFSVFLVIDCIQAKVLNNSPLIKITKNFDGSTVDKLDVGILTKTYYCKDFKKTIFKWEEYTCPNITNNTDFLTAPKITWEEITENGVNEELLLKNININILNEIGNELQTLVNEAYEEERANPEIIVTEGWARILEYERFKKLVDIGDSAMKPLYLIIYKSQNRGVYEYLCAYALYKISGYDFFWSTTDEFMEKFNEEVIKQNNP